MILINLDSAFGLEWNFNLEKPDILPGDLFYGFKTSYEDTQEDVWSYFDSTVSAKLAGQHAAERLREVEELESQDRPVPTYVSKRYEEKITKAEKLIEHVKEKQSDARTQNSTSTAIIDVDSISFAIDLIKNREDIIKIRELYSSHNECNSIPSLDRAECYERLDVEINDMPIVQKYCKSRINSGSLSNDRVSYDILKENCAGIPNVPANAYKILYGDL